MMSGTGWASVRGIEGFESSHAEIGWLRFERRVKGKVEIGVLLWPGEGEARFTGEGGRFIVEVGSRADELTFRADGVELRSRARQ